MLSYESFQAHNTQQLPIENDSEIENYDWAIVHCCKDVQLQG